MANKDLIKRAFSVTSNLSPARSDTLTEAPGVGQALTPSAENPPEMRPARGQGVGGARTGPGSMLAFMTDQSEVHQEVKELREKVAGFEGADVAKQLDPRTVVPSRWANRDESHFQSASFDRLKDEISAAGGNVQPIKVRGREGTEGSSARWEIVFGHRRHRACLELGLPVLALLKVDMSDADVFVEMERENRNREDLSAWEQGVMYVRALESGLFPSAKQMATAINRDMGNISRAMALAKLPSEVVQAFGSPLNLQFRWASPLRDAHQKDPEKLLALARELASQRERPAASRVFAILTSSDSDRKPRTSVDVEWKDADGRRAAHLSTDQKGKLLLQFNNSFDADQTRKLIKAIDALLGLKH